MTTQPPAADSSQAPALRVLRAGAVAGALDLLLALGVQYAAVGRVDLVRILLAIASGVLGRDARGAGLGGALLGLVLHFLIATIWAALLFEAARRLGWLSRLTASPSSRVGVGLVYGVVVWLGMNLVVVPLSRAPSGIRLNWITALMIVGHAAMVGLPIALALGHVRLSAAAGRPAGRIAA